jgi:hypothetical protein
LAVRMVVDEIGSGSPPVVDFVIGDVELNLF